MFTKLKAIKLKINYEVTATNVHKQRKELVLTKSFFKRELIAYDNHRNILRP